MDNRAHISHRFTKCPDWAKCWNFADTRYCLDCRDMEHYKSHTKGMSEWENSEEGLAYYKEKRRQRHIKDAINAKRRKQYARRKKK